MFTKTILLAGIALGGIVSSYAGAQAASSGVMGCQPHDWLAFGEAIENQDNEALQAMLSLPQIHQCEEIVNTIIVLTCATDASLCPPPPVTIPDIPPVIYLIDGGDDVPPPAPPAPEGDEDEAWEPFPGQRPGCGLTGCGGGDRNDFSDADTGGDDGNGGGGSSPAGAAPARG